MIRIGSIVEWDAMDGETERGTVIAITGTWATVEYSPWGDMMDAPIARLRLWIRKETTP